MHDITRLLFVKVSNIKRYKEKTFEFSCVNSQNVVKYSLDNDVFALSDNFYVNKLISILGTNASGKTTTIEMLKFICLVFLCNRNLNNIEINKFLKTIYIDSPIEVDLFYTKDKKVYHLESRIIKDDEDEEFYFVNEIIFERSLNTAVNKSNYRDSDTYSKVMERLTLNNEMKAFLELDKSISWITIGNKDQSIIDFYDDNDSIRLHTLDTSVEIIQYFDKSIEYVKNVSVENSRKSLYLLKFYSSNKAMELTYSELWTILSSGTRKGLLMFNYIISILRSGGYFVVDEIENHFHKSIIIDIIRLFRSKDTNPNAATLIFSTHYSEIVDVLDRNDSIYIANKEQKSCDLSLVNLSKLQKRTDIKKSEWYLNDAGKVGTTISYDAYMRLHKSIVKMFSKNRNQNSKIEE
ncbi:MULTISPECIES: AAA family ATPase [unclassified Breznakia]|uniref:AAA family ATPase n=1 Tax=unclassified Breznakia TaxID=2623764 RepID=UPI0024739A5E|nr:MULTISPECIES: AAA family ATPase [unclassified Breznakia]MDH6366242.1 ABC-type multidrug transport system ATPase subunit [Breznakia sp. PH1-1]MDH6403335.1 ABC-type multidrug transport system ATPase subunit [Breznakia sp. PF1-11]MDH6411044.1 ABC-type multidrug transport system ATPase subunit [Breznakia sp. PFB1-11]MDH6413408.1 ABC-type multidrug transport system ATPase subunit [Breznakia sp. PFB1-14]MDH6416173.1 ABC-type multidrug transport system ATPase subunit [Breznakia sp. PFB1-4]